MRFTIPVNSLARKSSRTLWIGLAFMGVISFATAMGRQHHGWLNLIAAFYGAALFAGSVLYLVFGKGCELVVDGSGVRGRINWRHRLDVSWTDITKVGFIGQHLRLQLNDGTTNSIGLAYLTYAERRDIERKLQSILANHGIAILQNAASKRRYDV